MGVWPEQALFTLPEPISGQHLIICGKDEHNINWNLLKARIVKRNCLLHLVLAQYIKKQRRYFVNKVHLVKAMVFPVVMYGCESWTIKKAEHQRIDTFELWCWRRLLRVPWTERRSNQSVLKGINPECSLEGLMLKLKLQYFGHMMWRADSFEKTLMLGKIEGRRRQRMRSGWHHQLNGHEFE